MPLSYVTGKPLSFCVICQIEIRERWREAPLFILSLLRTFHSYVQYMIIIFFFFVFHSRLNLSEVLFLFDSVLLWRGNHLVKGGRGVTQVLLLLLCFSHSFFCLFIYLSFLLFFEGEECFFTFCFFFFSVFACGTEHRGLVFSDCAACLRFDWKTL